METPREEYTEALRLGKKELAELTAAGKSTEPAVLEKLVPDLTTLPVTELGVVEIPAERIVGVRTAARAGAFTPGFLPLMSADSEFGQKWMALCAAHLSDIGIQQPILCYEYLGNFYVQEGNKRVSVLRYFGAPRIPAQVIRILPPKTEEPCIRAYYEFLEFYRHTKLYCLLFRKPRSYEKLLTYLNRDPEEDWTREERRSFESKFHLFRVAVQAVGAKNSNVSPEEALLLWLELYPFEQISSLSAAELKKSVAALWNDVVTVQEESVSLEPTVEKSAKPGLISRILTSVPDRLNIALIQSTDSAHGWSAGHAKGMAEMAEALGDRVTVRCYDKAATAAEIEAALAQAVADGAQAVFTTAPQMSRATLKAALQNPKLYFFNCSVSLPYSSIRTYYGRVFEAKFITGAIAGAMAENDRVGYIASYPTFGVPASINAFALGAQMTNPRVKIALRWACVDGLAQAELFAEGIRVISNRDVPVASKTYLDFCNYGTYLMDDQGELVPLASPVWAWGKFYEQAVRGILDGTLKNEKTALARNYWLGMDSGVIDVDLSDRLPQGVRRLALLLKEDIASKRLTIFPDSTMEELIHMDRLNDNVIGGIPAYEELLPGAKRMAQELGLYRDALPIRKENET